MKYIYYILAIVIVFSAFAAYGLFDTKVEISHPLFSVNDRVVSEKEFNKMLEHKPAWMTKKQFMDSVIDKQILIQEAIKTGINKEESFRRAVENFYEQSLIKILLDRKLKSLVVDVSDDEIAKYENYLGYRIFLTRFVYPDLDSARSGKNCTGEKIDNEFINLSDDLKFIVLNLEPGQSSKPRQGKGGVIVYRLDKIEKIKKPDNGRTGIFNLKKVSVFLQDMKKEQLLEEWTDKLRASAHIWRKK